MSKGLPLKRLEAEHAFARAMARGDEDRAVDALDRLRETAICFLTPAGDAYGYVRTVAASSMRRGARVVVIAPRRGRR